jgi:ATP-dependent helicase HepA
MESFFPDQRWSSEGEPELGVGIVKSVENGRVKIDFPLSGETRLYAMENAPLRRVLFKIGDTIKDAQDRPLVVDRVDRGDDLITYFGGGRSLSEAELGNVSVTHGVDDRLRMGEVDTPAMFALRRNTLGHDHLRKISPVRGFLGGRIDLIPHQLYIGHEVSSRYAPRVLLSDEVGLGKTIEACLILHRLLLSGRISRVLILVPESLVHQWFVEILRRFNLWFHIFDEERCEAIEGGAPDGNPFLDDQLILCSTGFLAKSPKRARQALGADWDMLVVDEAHHLQWSEEQASPEYLIVEQLSQVAQGLLLLTATPEQLGLQSHFARLRLLDPDRYADFETFKNESQDNKEIADLVEKLSSAKPLGAADIRLLKSLFGKESIKALEEGGEGARNEMIEDLLDQHGPGRVIFRNTRAAMRGFPERHIHLIPLQAKKDQKLWLDRLSQEFASDIHSGEKPAEQQFWFEDDPRVNWLLKFMSRLHPAKVLLICRSKEKALALEEALRQRANFKVGLFHEDLTIVQRDRNAAWFSKSDGARLLVCSEIGSEGRNFQFAHHLILFDLPFHPELLEQRIGRLDRIGQSEDIQIHVPYVVGSPQEVLVRWFHEGLQAFEQRLEGGDKIFSLFGERLRETALAVSESGAAPQLKSLIADTAAFRKELKETLAQGRDRLLEMNSFRPKVAEKLAERIREEDLDPSLETYMMQVFEHFAIEIEDLAPRTYLLQPSRQNQEIFPSIPQEGVSVTFDRTRALSREDLSFISWDHPMATEAIDRVLGSGTGGASYGILRGTGSQGILLEVLFVLEATGGQNLHVDRFLPHTPLRVVVDHSGEHVTASYPAAWVDQRLIAGQIDPLLDNEVLVETIIPNMIDAASEFAEQLGALEASRAMGKMERTLHHEIARLKALQEKNQNIRTEEIALAEAEQAALAESIQGARLRLDAVQLIQCRS